MLAGQLQAALVKLQAAPDNESLPVQTEAFIQTATLLYEGTVAKGGDIKAKRGLPEKLWIAGTGGRCGPPAHLVFATRKQWSANKKG